MRAIIFVNGDLPKPDAVRKLLRDDDYLIAADGGTRHALGLGLIPSVIIGDLDSLDSATLPNGLRNLPTSNDAFQSLETLDSKIIQFPEDKDETDLELALLHARERGFDEILLIGALGGRIDQTLGNLALLSDPAWEGIGVRVDDGEEEIFFARHQAQVEGRVGEIVSLIPWRGDVRIANTEGLRWSLQNETLYAHQTRGISNELTAENATVEIEDGLLLIIHTRSALHL